jgi:hypothetical protein
MKMPDVQAAASLKSLLALSHLLVSKGAALATSGVYFLFWPTSLEASGKLVLPGSRNPAVQRVVFYIKQQENSLGLMVFLVWLPRSTSRLASLFNRALQDH